MTTVKHINKLIFYKVFEIFFVMAFVFLAVYFWQSSNSQSMLTFASSQASSNFTTLSVENPIHYSMFPMQDDYAVQKLSPCTLKVVNDSLTTESYALYLKMNKESTIDYHYLHIAIDDTVYPLEQLIAKAEENHYYFLLDRNTMVGDSKNYEIKLWLNEKTGNEMQGKKLILSYEIAHEVTTL